MAELIAKSPLEGRGPVSKAGLTLQLVPEESIWSVALFPGADPEAVLQPLGLSFPAPGKSLRAGGAGLVWTGRDQAFLFAAPPPDGLADHAALTDQSGGWAGFLLTGPDTGCGAGIGAAIGAGPEIAIGAESALARLVPLDLRLSAFAEGDVARTGLNHIPLILWRTARAEFTLYVPRSMAATAWHELSEVLDRLAARAAQGGRS